MRINNNISALNAYNQLNFNTNRLQDAIKQISTGLRINSASDDAAGLAISENMRAQIKGLDQSIRNTQDGISLLQTAEGALSETNSMLQRMRELSVQAANDTLTSQDRGYIQMEIDDLKEQIDRIANTTHFNNKKILNGNCCGTCSSTDTTTKGYIRGSIKAEGNFKLDIKANPGAAQVQKSSIFKIKHENVATNQQLDSENGIGNLKIDSVPAGNYAITATKAGGGMTTTTYKSSASVNVESGNTSGIAETLRFSLTGQNVNGQTISSSTYTINVPDGASKSDVASLIAARLNGTITMRDAYYRAANFAVTAEVDSEGNCNIEATSTEGKLSQISFTSSLGTTTRNSISNTDTPNTTYTATLTGRATASNGSDTNIRVNITDGAYSGSYSVPGIRANMTADQITAAIQRIGNQTITLRDSSGNTKTVNLNGETASGANGYYALKATNGSNSSFNVSLSPGGIFQNTTPQTVSDTTHTTTGSGTITSGNTSNNTEKIKVFLSIYPSSNSYDDYLEIDVAAGADEATIAQAIADAANNKGSLKIDGTRNILINGNYTSGANYTLNAMGSAERLYFRVEVSSTADASTKVPDQNFAVDETAEVSTAAKTSLTGFYGNSDAADSISANVKVDTQNNASILFEVTSTSQDTKGNSIITLSANSHVLSANGDNSTYSKNNIIISTSSNTVNLGALLGEDDSNLTLTLDPSKFESGNKFVLNVSGNGTTKNPADTSLYVNGSLDSSWPLSWGDDYITYKNNELYYNVNASAVSNRELRLRNFYLNSDNGKVHDGEINLTVNKDFAAAAANFPEAPSEGQSRTNEINLASFTANYVGKVADGTTKLRDLEQFWDKSGVFMLEQPQVITITQNDGNKASITLNASDSLNDVRKKLNKAIAEDLGQEKYISGGYANNFVTFVENPTEGSGLETVKGTFLIRSVIPGSDGELTFSSTEGDLIDALGLNTVQNSQDSYYSVSVSNAHTGSSIASNIKTSENMLCGVIDENIDVEFSAMSGVKAIWSDKDKNFILVPENDSYSTVLHVVKNNIDFQVGANEGEKITIDIGDMSSAGLRINGVNVMTSERASKAITTIDRAIKSVSAQRAKIGSYQNTLETTMQNLTASNSNLTNAESRIRDADISQSMMDLIKFQIIHQSSTSMLAQANQAPQSVLSLLQ